MPIIRKISHALLGLVVALFLMLAVTVAAVNFVDWDKHRNVATWLVERFTPWQVVHLEKLRINLWRTAELRVGGLELRNTSSDSGLREIAARKAEIRVRTLPALLRGKVIVDRAELAGARVVVRQTESESPFDPKAFIDGLPSIFIASARITDTVLYYHAVDPNKMRREFILEEMKMESASALSDVTVRGHGRIDGASFALQGTLGSFNAFLDIKTAYPVSLETTFEEQLARVEGTIHLEQALYELQLLLEGNDLRPYLRLFPGSRDGMEKSPYHLSAKIRYVPHQLAIKDLLASIGRSQLKGAIEVQFAGMIRALDISIESARLRFRDVDFLLPGEERSREKEKEKDKKGGRELNLENFSVKAPDEDAPITLAAKGAFMSQPFELSGSLASLQSVQEEGDWDPIDLSLSIYGQMLKLQAIVDSRNETVRGSLHASGSDLGALLKAMRPGLRTTAISYEASLEASYRPRQIAFGNVRLRLGRSRVNGRARVDWTNPEASVDIRLAPSRVIFKDVASLLSSNPSDWGNRALQIKSLHIASQGERQPIRIQGAAQFSQLDFAIQGSLGSLSALKNEAQPYPIEAHFKLEEQSASIRASLNRSKEEYRARVSAQGESPTPLLLALGLRETGQARIPSYEASFELLSSPGTIAVKDFAARLGSSRLLANADINRNADKPHVGADITLPSLAFRDLKTLLPAEERTGPKSALLFTHDPLPFDWLHLLNADVRIVLEKFDAEGAASLLNEGRATIRLRDGNLTIDPLDISVAKGRVHTKATVDARSEPPRVAVDAKLSSLDLRSAVAPFARPLRKHDFKPREIVIGRLFGTAALSSRGQSMRQLASNADGRIRLAIDNGHIGSTIVEALGFDITETIISWFKDHPPTPINCAISEVNVSSGLMRTEIFLTSTRDSNIQGSGYIDLNKEYIDLSFDTRAKDFSIGSFQTPVEITGPFQSIKLHTRRQGIILRTAAAVALGVLVNPAATVLPLIELGLGKEGQCRLFEPQLADIRNDSRPPSVITTR